MGHTNDRAHRSSDDYADVAWVMVEAVCQRLSIGKATFYEIVDQFDPFKIGSRPVVGVESIRRPIQRWIDDLCSGAIDGQGRRDG
jgi:predicted DNA-binding transcriptional regulator AlpA